jgi:SAM-dependent methyltransferase
MKKSIILFLTKNKKITRKLISFFVFLHNFSYRKISWLAVIDNKNIHPKHKIMKYYKFFQKNVSQNDFVLDVGCGNGLVSYEVSKKAKKVIGIDIENNNIKRAKNNCRRDNLDFIIGDATKYDFKNKVDVIILSNVLEHIENRVELLKKLEKISSKFLIRVPLITRSWVEMYKKIKGFDYKLDDTHFIEYEEKEFREELKKVGLKIEEEFVQWGEMFVVCKKIK